MKIVIYDHNPNEGYAIYAQSSNVNHTDEDETNKIAGLESDTFNEAGTAIRFAPHRIPGSFILTVIRRGLVHEGQSRSYYHMADYVLSEEEADRLFLTPFPELEKDVAEFSEQLFTRLAVPEAAEDAAKRALCDSAAGVFLDYLRPKEPETVPGEPDEELRKALFMALAYGYSSQESGQVYVIVEPEEGSCALSWLLYTLPLSMRKRVSFFLNAISARETVGVNLVFYHHAAYEHLQKTNFNGVANMNRSTYDAKRLEVNRHELRTRKEVEVFLTEPNALKGAREYLNILKSDNWAHYRACVSAFHAPEEQRREELRKEFSLEELSAIEKSRRSPDGVESPKNAVPAGADSAPKASTETTSSKKPDAPVKKAPRFSWFPFSGRKSTPASEYGRKSNSLQRILCALLMCVLALCIAKTFLSTVRQEKRELLLMSGVSMDAKSFETYLRSLPGAVSVIEAPSEDADASGKTRAYVVLDNPGAEDPPSLQANVMIVDFRMISCVTCCVLCLIFGGLGVALLSPASPAQSPEPARQEKTL